MPSGRGRRTGVELQENAAVLVVVMLIDTIRLDQTNESREKDNCTLVKRIEKIVRSVRVSIILLVHWLFVQNVIRCKSLSLALVDCIADSIKSDAEEQRSLHMSEAMESIFFHFSRQHKGRIRVLLFGSMMETWDGWVEFPGLRIEQKSPLMISI